MSTEVRPITATEHSAWAQTLNRGFLRAEPVTPGDVALRAAAGELGRVQGAFDSETGGCVGTFRSFTQELTVPGGATVTASAVTNVSVLSTHRRQGLLTRMMAAEFAAATARGDVLSTLIAAEYPIYGRYGYGPAVYVAEWEIDVARTGLDSRRAAPAAGGGRIELVDVAEVRRSGPALHERIRATRHGMTGRTARWWRLATGEEEFSFRPYKPKLHAVYRTAAGEVAGLVSYRSDDHWTDAKVPLNTLRVEELLAATPEAERALWHFLCSVDWALRIRTGLRATDDLAPGLLPDPRAAAILTHADFLWVRVLDVVRALGARTYEVPGVLVLEVTDPAGLSGGRFRLDAGTGRCEATGDPADLRLDVAALGSLYLGDGSAVRLGALGQITELRPGALALADAVFRTSSKPWSPDVF
ncbi:MULTISPECIES: GNAT family N-acetyltransferase [Streptomyces]|uniref:GNAT family N-acetyltransferase n=1 Tax=Streptomyces TaxID=1883 RepID=UPI002FC5B5D2